MPTEPRQNRVVAIDCDELYPEEINDLQGLLKSRYHFDVEEITISEASPAGASIGFLQIHTTLLLRFNLRLGRTERGAIKNIVKTVDEILYNSSREENREPKVLYGPDDKVVVSIHESTRPRRKKEQWTRGEKIAAWTLCIALVAIAVSFFIPEVRRFLGLEKKAETTRVETQTPPRGAQPQAQPSKPRKSEPPETAPKPNKTRPTQRIATHVSGKGNIAGNNILSHNSVAENNIQATPIAIAPNGIPSSGGNVQNPIVNNFAPPARRLVDSQANELVKCLRTNPGLFSIAALQGNSEAYTYAKDWLDVFLSAGWKNNNKEIPIAIFMIGGGMWSGMRVNVHNASALPALTMSQGSPEKKFSDCVTSRNDIPDGAAIILYPERPTGSVDIEISDHP